METTLGGDKMAQLKRVTMQTIADACGLSRNTVSKIFNGRGTVPDSTKELVLAKARELGYFVNAESVLAPPSRNIALLTHSRPSLHAFGSLFITNFTDQICRSGFNLKIFEIGDKNYAVQSLPSHFIPEEISGIVTLELFDREYTQMLCGLGIPLILVDSFAGARGELIQCDLMYMENFASTAAMTSRMIAAGAKTVGFVGDIDHCCSFRERWYGFCSAMTDANLTVDKSLCILAEDSLSYGEVDWMQKMLDTLPYIPDAFVCCNDFIAIRVIWALQKRGLSVPENVMVTGFDGTNEAQVVSPTLTTSRIPNAEIGRSAADLLMERIADPTIPYRCTYLRTTPVWADSVRKI